MRGGMAYERVMFTRLEFEWLYNHPPLSLLDPRYMWVPTGEDNTGINDRHWLVNRKDAAVRILHAVSCPSIRCLV